MILESALYPMAYVMYKVIDIEEVADFPPLFKPLDSLSATSAIVVIGTATQNISLPPCCFI